MSALALISMPWTWSTWWRRHIQQIQAVWSWVSSHISNFNCGPHSKWCFPIFPSSRLPVPVRKENFSYCPWWVGWREWGGLRGNWVVRERTLLTTKYLSIIPCRTHCDIVFDSRNHPKVCTSFSYSVRYFCEISWSQGPHNLALKRQWPWNLDFITSE